MTITGITLYISPPGRVAHWSNWLFIGISKEDWQSLHTLFSFIWVLAMVFHLIFNWKPILSYIRKKVDSGSKLKKELVFAAALSLIIFFGTFTQVTPFNYVMDFGEYMTNSWSSDETEPPVPHAELFSAADFSKTIGITTQKFVSVMNANGYPISDTLATIQSIGAEFQIAPSLIYNLFKSENAEIPQNILAHAGSGYGRKNISEVFDDNNLTWQQGISILKGHGIILQEDDKLKNIAEKNNILPIDLINMISSPGQ